jgi:ribosomal protein uS5
LVKAGKITNFEEIFRFAIPIKEPQIVDHLVKKANNTLKEEVMKVKPVQKQTKAGQRTRFKAWILIGDEAGHIGLGQKAHKEVQGAIKGATQDAKMNFVPIRKGYWGNKLGVPHTVPFKMTGRCGSVRCRLVPAPRGTAIVGAPTSKKVLQFAGISDCYTQSRGSTKTKGNFLYAVFFALVKTYGFMTPEFWGKPMNQLAPHEEHSDFLSKKVDQY